MKKCLLCNRPLNVSLSLDFLLTFKPYQTPVICHPCRERFKQISKKHCCQDCSRTGDFKTGICPDCQRWRSINKPFKNHSLYQYNSMMSEFMQRYKFQGDYRLRKVFQNKLSRYVIRSKRIVVPIPIHQSTYERRGFNQVLGLLKDVPMVKALVTQSDRKRTPQSSKSRQDRLQLRQPFKVVDKLRNRIKDQKLLIVDDVYTTGTTIRHAADQLRSAGAKSVTGITLAR